MIGRRSAWLCGVISFGIWLAGCDSSPPKGSERLDGTREVNVTGPTMSMSPSGKYLVFVTRTAQDDLSDERMSYGISSMDLHTGTVTKHYPSLQVSPEVREQLSREKRAIGLSMFFSEIAWKEDVFYYQYSPVWLRVDPGKTKFSEVDGGDVPVQLLSSDRIPKATLSARIERYHKAGALGGIWVDTGGLLSNDIRQFRVTYAASGCDSIVCFLGRGDFGGSVYCSDGKTAHEIISFENKFFRPAIRQIRLSPYGKYLAVLLSWELDKHVPFPGTGDELRIFDMSESEQFFEWRSQASIGSIIWGPKGENLYFASNKDGKGIFKLRILDVNP